MAQIKGQAGVNLSQELANYLDANQGNKNATTTNALIMAFDEDSSDWLMH